MRPHRLQHTKLPCPSLFPGDHSNSYPFSQWCYLTISPSAVLFSFCLQSFPASGSFPMSLLGEYLKFLIKRKKKKQTSIAWGQGVREQELFQVADPWPRAYTHRNPRADTIFQQKIMGNQESSSGRSDRAGSLKTHQFCALLWEVTAAEPLRPC